MAHCVGLPALETYILILISTVFVNNIVMAKILGLCPFMGVSKKLETAIGMGLATTFVLTLASGASYLINEYLLGTELFYLRTLSFIVVIAGIVQFTEMFIHKTSPVLYQVLGIYLPLITTNCAVLGIPLLNVQEQHGFVESLFFGAGGALGFTLVLILFAGIRERLDTCDVPVAVQGQQHRDGHRGADVARLHGLLRAGEIMLAAILVMVGIAVVTGLVLGWSAIRFKVEGNPLAEKIDAILPQTQCGQCGYPRLQALRRGDRQGRGRHQPVPAGRRRRHEEAGRPARRGTQAARRSPRHAQAEIGRRSSTSRPASAARCASRPARSTRSPARPSRCTPSSPPNAPAASCACRRARSTASRWCRSPRTCRTGNGSIR